MIYENLLITGCGGDIGLTLGDIASNGGHAARVIGCDMVANHAGDEIFDTCVSIPRADDPSYLDQLEAIADRYCIEAIVPMSEAELGRLMREDSLDRFRGRDVIAANRKAIEIGLDKLATNHTLRKAGLLAPWTVAVSDGDPLDFPCIIKPRQGQGGKGLRRVVDMTTAKALAPAHQDYIWQELILPDEAEFTCGLFRAKNGDTRSLVFRRQLQGDVTKLAEVVEDTTIEKLLKDVAVAVDLEGAINVQLRVDRQGPKVFEINPRFSSTVGFRHRLGFRDFVWSLQDRRNLALEGYAPPLVGTRVFRGISVLVVAPKL
jgi:carbamoyl-phosphate synthase large subunit